MNGTRLGRFCSFGGIVALILCLGVFFAAGCGRKEAPGGAAVKAAVVPGADFYGSMEFGLARDSAIAEIMREAGGDVRRIDFERKMQIIEEAAGLTDKDISRAVMSGNFKALSLGGEQSAEEIERVDVVAAVVLEKTLSWEQLLGAAQALTGDNPRLDVTSIELEGRSVVAVSESEEKYPDLLAALSADGRAVYFTLSRIAMSGAIMREQKDREEIPVELAKVIGDLDGESQIKAGFVLPANFRGKIEEALSGKGSGDPGDPGSAVLTGILAPFRKVAGLSLGLRFSENLDVSLSIDMGGPEEAVQAAALLQTMVLPMAKARLAGRPGAAAGGIDERISAVARGDILGIRATLTADDYQTMEGAGTKVP